MKRGLKFAVLVLGIFVLIGGLIPGVLGACPNGIVSYWNFDESSGVNANDIFGSNDGTLTNMDPLTDWVPGKSGLGNALDFDGINDYVNIGDKANLESMSTLTISAWIYPRSAVEGTIIAKNGPYALRMLSDRRIIGQLYLDGAWGSAVYSTNSVALNSWSQATLTYNGTNLNIYINNNLEGSIPKTGSLSPSAASVQIGNNTDLGFNQGFNGLIDEVVIYNRALSSAEINEIYQKNNNGVNLCSNCLSDDDIIMKLYNSNNSHGALWNNTLYTYDICYDDIFGVPGSGIHTCSGTNSILWLYQANNSHASDINANGYNIPVCYGDLTCRNVTTACAGDEEIVARLYQDTNSHISNASDTNYPIKICCKAGGAPPTGNVYWANMQGAKIGNDVFIQAQKGDTVLMIFENTGLSPGSITFEIYEDDFISGDDDIRTIASGNAITGTVDASGKATGQWTITQGDLDNTADLNNFIFRVTGNKSNELTINQTQQNNPPVAGIIGIKDRQIYFKDEILNFSQNSYDVDDEFTYRWDLGNGEIRTGDSITWENYNFTYSYTAPGQKEIILTVTDSRGLVSRDKVAILVLDGTSAPQVLAYISQPTWDELILQRSVFFNATLSYAANWSGSVVNCLAGPCPLKTEGCYGVNPIYPGCQVTLGIISNSLNPLFFNWTFINGLYPDLIKNHSGNGLAGANVSINYDNPTVPSYPHKAILEVTY